jgi:hypothetical protein
MKRFALNVYKEKQKLKIKNLTKQIDIPHHREMDYS